MSNNDSIALNNKILIKSLLDGIANANPDNLRQNLQQAYHPQANWRGSHPLNELKGLAAIEAVVWLPLLRAFPDLERRDNI